MWLLYAAGGLLLVLLLLAIGPMGLVALLLLIAMCDFMFWVFRHQRWNGNPAEPPPPVREWFFRIRTFVWGPAKPTGGDAAFDELMRREFGDDDVH